MKVSILFIILGLALGAAYPAYTSFFSGKEIAELPFISRDTSNVSLGGFSLSSSEDAGSVSEQSIDLSPDMNPIRLYATAKYTLNRGSRSSNLKSGFEVSFYQNDKQLWTEPFSFSESSSNDKKTAKTVNSSQILRRIDLAAAGSYTLKLRKVGSQELNISSLKIKARRNVTIANPKIYIAGGVLFLLGLIGAYIFRNKSSAKDID